jgi:hypothetical protein
MAMNRIVNLLGFVLLSWAKGHLLAAALLRLFDYMSNEAGRNRHRSVIEFNVFRRKAFRAVPLPKIADKTALSDSGTLFAGNIDRDKKRRVC